MAKASGLKAGLVCGLLVCGLLIVMFQMAMLLYSMDKEDEKSTSDGDLTSGLIYRKIFQFCNFTRPQQLKNDFMYE